MVDVTVYKPVGNWGVTRDTTVPSDAEQNAWPAEDGCRQKQGDRPQP